ncbi:hypothetical protein V8E36_008010 [Tilletia maclaganii]
MTSSKGPSRDTADVPLSFSLCSLATPSSNFWHAAAPSMAVGSILHLIISRHPWTFTTVSISLFQPFFLPFSLSLCLSFSRHLFFS